jgi:hypothetical protein
MKEAPGSSKTSVLTEPHGVTTQKTPFFRFIFTLIYKADEEQDVTGGCSTKKNSAHLTAAASSILSKAKFLQALML